MKKSISSSSISSSRAKKNEVVEQQAPVVLDALAAATETSTIDVRLVNWRWRDSESSRHRREKQKSAFRPPAPTEAHPSSAWEEPRSSSESTLRGSSEVAQPQKPRWGIWALLRGNHEANKVTVLATKEEDVTPCLALGFSSSRSFGANDVDDAARKKEVALQQQRVSSESLEAMAAKAAEEEALDEQHLDEQQPEEEEEEEDEVPVRFLGAVRGDRAAAKKRWAETTAFRDAGNRPEEVLRRPQPFFHKIKARHRHFIHKTDRQGHILAFEVVDNPNRAFRELAAEGVTVEDVAQHAHFVSAFTYVKILDDVDEVGKKPKDPGGYFLKVIDLKHIGLGDCGGDTARYFRLVAAINRHYPERVWKTIIINAPSIFGVVWTIVSPLLEPNVREKITVLRSNYKDTLRDLVDPDDLPVEYGGNDADPSPEEVALANFADDLNRKEATQAAEAAQAAIDAAEAAEAAHTADAPETQPVVAEEPAFSLAATRSRGRSMPSVCSSLEEDVFQGGQPTTRNSDTYEPAETNSPPSDRFFDAFRRRAPPAEGDRASA
mmetsp:Transcript_19073/g.58767  ORF Transcript_19073/g.58767 Transcript_19073/m.58767 type:complete len:550 (-) Transcript_19073:1137-2786(-)